jgi:tripartite-type tricarboxylate transporter receptor subunit TctC
MDKNNGSRTRTRFSAGLKCVLSGAMLSALGVLATAAPAAYAQTYPSHSLRLIVPFAPGGGNDFIARFIAQKITTGLGQAVVVENRPGAGGLLGVEDGVRAAPDGYTLTLISLSYTVNPSLYKLKFDSLADITPIVQISEGPLVMVATPSLAAKTTEELIALAKSEPGKINYASSGNGSIIHLASAYFASMAKIQLMHIPYKGGGPAMTDTISGRTQLFFSSIPEALPFINAGKLRAIAVTSPHRNAALPNVPTVAESGLPGYDVTLWHGLIGPKGMPAAAVARINSEVTRALATPEAAKLLRENGFAPAPGTPEQFRAKIVEGLDLWGKVAKSAGVKPE